MFRLADATHARFAPFGIAVFFSVPLFAAIVSLLALREEPLVQPAAFDPRDG